jgi:hypothetical protein
VWRQEQQRRRQEAVLLRRPRVPGSYLPADTVADGPRQWTTPHVVFSERPVVRPIHGPVGCSVIPPPALARGSAPGHPRLAWLFLDAARSWHHGAPLHAATGRGRDAGRRLPPAEVHPQPHHGRTPTRPCRGKNGAPFAGGAVDGGISLLCNVRNRRAQSYPAPVPSRSCGAALASRCHIRGGDAPDGTSPTGDAHAAATPSIASGRGRSDAGWRRPSYRGLPLMAIEVAGHRPASSGTTGAGAPRVTPACISGRCARIDTWLAKRLAVEARGVDRTIAARTWWNGN